MPQLFLTFFLLFLLIVQDLIRLGSGCRGCSYTFHVRLGECIHFRITKDVNNDFYCCYVRCVTFIIRVGGMPWPKTGATRAQLKSSHAIKEMVIWWVLLNLKPLMFKRKRRDLAPISDVRWPWTAFYYQNKNCPFLFNSLS